LESIEAFVTPVPDPRVGYRHLRCICTVINVLEFVDGISRRALLFIRHVRTAAQFVHVSVRGTSEDASVGTCIRQCTTRLISNSHANSFTAAQRRISGVGTLRGFEHFSRAVSLDLSGVPALGSWEVGIVDGDQYAAAYIVQRGCCARKLQKSYLHPAHSQVPRTFQPRFAYINSRTLER